MFVLIGGSCGLFWGLTGSVKVKLLFEDGTSGERTFQLNPNSRFNVSVGQEFPEAAEKRVDDHPHRRVCYKALEAVPSATHRDPQLVPHRVLDGVDAGLILYSSYCVLRLSPLHRFADTRDRVASLAAYPTNSGLAL